MNSMAKMIPALIDHTSPSPGEHEIFWRLKEEPETRDWIVLHSLDIAHHIKQVSGEIDFLVIIPYLGVLCVEVKACHQLVRRDGMWYYGNNPKPDPRGPFKQASTAMHSLRLKLAQYRPDLAGVVFWSAVVFPYLTFTSPSEEWHWWQVIDNQTFYTEPLSKQLARILENARDFLQRQPHCRWFNPKKSEPSPSQCEEIAQALRPDFAYMEDPQGNLARITSEIKYYTEEQQVALGAMETNPRVIFSGPAGTGKTFLAMEAAKRSAEQGHKVLLLCFNRLLGKWLQNQMTQLQPLVITSTLHSYMLEVAGVRVEDHVESGQTFWKKNLPCLAINKLNDMGSEHLYDEIIIDEAQDILLPPYIKFIHLILKGGLQSGRWRVFGDFEKQAIYAEESAITDILKSWTGEVPIYSLRMNCRNTPRIGTIAQRVGELSPSYSRILRSDDGVNPEIYFYRDNYSQKQLLVRTVKKLEQTGYTRSNIVILSPKAAGSCTEGIDKGIFQSCETAGQDHIKYCSIHAYKGLESVVVIVTDIEQVGDILASNLMYVAVTRSIHRLIIFSHSRIKKELELVLRELPIDLMTFTGGADEVGQNIVNRDKIITVLGEELVGPSPQGQEFDCSGDIYFANKKDSYLPRRQKGGEEILLLGRPTARYGVGVLHPLRKLQ